jgi:hypothetical protein
VPASLAVSWRRVGPQKSAETFFAARRLVVDARRHTPVGPRSPAVGAREMRLQRIGQVLLVAGGVWADMKTAES